ncbi:MAG: sigma 54-dependent Fis family transcriptional regulator [Deltaproteobacteria bacterium]|nr:sigma 54-dependent Fis family transcriptional regulator [Deltaproteobacteria bacterium]
MTQLIFSKSGQTVFKRTMEKNEITIGRDADCDIQLADNDISRKHCLLYKDKETIVVKDTSRNGTWVNKKRITQCHLRAHDEIQIGVWTIQPFIDFQIIPEETFIHERKTGPQKNQLGDMLGNSKAMQTVFDLIRKAAPTEITVCLVGESGTGKELAAQSIHNLSPRHGKPFVAVNCGAIPENLIESILFGHEKGSFSGATEKHAGVFEEADGGTLFLDEIGEMPIDLQTRLLRVLETRTVRRVGGKQDYPVDIRLIAATNRDLQKLITQEKFRQDLFYRLYVFPIHLAPLREKSEDILLLANHFLNLFSLENGGKKLSEEAATKLKNHEWRGNIRELKNIIQRSLLLSQSDTIEAEEIELAPLTSIKMEVGELELGAQEKLSILEVLKKTNGNQAKTARHLGIARTTLASKLRRYHIKPSK